MTGETKLLLATASALGAYYLTASAADQIAAERDGQRRVHRDTLRALNDEHHRVATIERENERLARLAEARRFIGHEDGPPDVEVDA